MFKKVLKLKNISVELLDFLKKAVEECFADIENGAAKFEKYLGKFEDLNLTKDDNDLLDLLEFRLVYINKLRHHYWIYETSYNENVFDLVSVHFNNRTFEKLHFLNCPNVDIKDSSEWPEDCDCFNDIFHAVVYDVSYLVNNRYEEVCDLEEKYKDLCSEVEDRIESLEEEKESAENDKNN